MTNPLDKLIHELSKLPSIGERTAMRLALHILRAPAEYGQALARALSETVGKVGFCQSCHNITMTDLCDLCRSTRRDAHIICVVEEVADLIAIERVHSFRGVYHVLHGALSPIDGIGPDQLRMRELIERLKNNTEIREIIFATNPNVNGDATALYLARLIKPMSSVKITRLASGIPVGGHIEFIDHNTLSKALENRSVF